MIFKAILILLVLSGLIISTAIISTTSDPIGHISHFLGHYTIFGLKFFGLLFLLLLMILIGLAIIASIISLFRKDD